MTGHVATCIKHCVVMGKGSLTLYFKVFSVNIRKIYTKNTESKLFENLQKLPENYEKCLEIARNRIFREISAQILRGFVIFG